MALGRGTRSLDYPSSSIWTCHGGETLIDPVWSWSVYGEVVHLTRGGLPVLLPELPEAVQIYPVEEIPKQGEGQKESDSSIVFMKSEPVKASNGLEDKTLMTGA